MTGLLDITRVIGDDGHTIDEQRVTGPSEPFTEDAQLDLLPQGRRA